MWSISIGMKTINDLTKYQIFVLIPRLKVESNIYEKFIKL